MFSGGSQIGGSIQLTYTKFGQAIKSNEIHKMVFNKLRYRVLKI